MTPDKHQGRALTKTAAGSNEPYMGDHAGGSVIFLDVDGVLNCASTRERIFQCIGIDPEKVRVLAKIVEMMQAKIVLSSSWKDGWDPDPSSCDDFGRYLTESLALEGLEIADKTADDGTGRGEGILKWMRIHGPLSAYLILDDERFDFKTCGIAGHWLQTSYFGSRGGLQEKHLAYIRKRMNQYKTEEI